MISHRFSVDLAKKRWPTLAALWAIGLAALTWQLGLIALAIVPGQFLFALLAVATGTLVAGPQQPIKFHPALTGLSHITGWVMIVVGTALLWLLPLVYVMSAFEGRPLPR